ncbi:MAG: hypothetical protein M3P18_03210 [Actinomycetota bacterium]|nr:hypothetical protein [Actinomycetota bacterium]
MTIRARARRAVQGFLLSEDPPAIQARLDNINHQVVHIEVRLERLEGSLTELRRRLDETDEALRYMIGEVSHGSQHSLALLLAIHHVSVESAAHPHAIAAHLHAIVEEVRAEREATFASNDAASVKLAEVTQELARFGRLAALGAEQLERALDRRTLPDMVTIESSIDHARELVEVARSQYRDPMPKDAAPIEPLCP